ncbi:hypothetical protein QYE76_017645 [Lolium multiflorum]|uniref:DDE Tnp4 domain-containing protein n=1 Tax=Lolium multiflorum TaxID=4521 RepID=A0AAD8V165_LOLMU|nr:hypothetical protein QYE76_017645 [Lolium multiflorum]
MATPPPNGRAVPTYEANVQIEGAAWGWGHASGGSACGTGEDQTAERCLEDTRRLARKTRYRLNEFSLRNRPQTAKELFNLRHSRLRVTIERAFAALKNRFKVLDQKPFHTFDTQVKLVLACCILHNWILGWGEDDFLEEVVTFDEVETGHGVEAGDNDAWKEKRQEWADAMWEARGNTTI